MDNHVVSHTAWLEARQQFLVREKEFTRLRDQLSQQRRELPWERVDKNYSFEGPTGPETLSTLFAGHHQLIVYHFMFDPSWEEGCPHCSFWADNFNGITVHLDQRDAHLVAISRAPFAKLSAFKQRMGWTFPWFSSFGTDFNYDFNVSFTPQELTRGDAIYNYRQGAAGDTEMPGISVFYKDQNGEVFHTYSTYERGIDMVNGAYHFLDLTPKGRDEEGHDDPQYWVRFHDRYDDATAT